MNIAFFYIIAAAILIFSVLSVTSRKILRAATYLLFVDKTHSTHSYFYLSSDIILFLSHLLFWLGELNGEDLADQNLA